MLHILQAHEHIKVVTATPKDPMNKDEVNGIVHRINREKETDGQSCSNFYI